MTTATVAKLTTEELAKVLTLAQKRRSKGFQLKADKIGGVHLRSPLWDSLEGKISVREDDEGRICIVASGKKYTPCNNSAQASFLEWVEAARAHQQSKSTDYGNPKNCFDRVSV